MTKTDTQHAPAGSGGGPAVQPISPEQVDFTHYPGGGGFQGWLADACARAQVPFNEHWRIGYETLCMRESSHNPNAVNGEADGPPQADGKARNSARGIAQCRLDTFAAFHAASSTHYIYDPVANIAASINYVRSRYGVALDGHDFAAKVQQADPNRKPHWY